MHKYVVEAPVQTPFARSMVAKVFGDSDAVYATARPSVDRLTPLKGFVRAVLDAPSNTLAQSKTYGDGADATSAATFSEVLATSEALIAKLASGEGLLDENNTDGSELFQAFFRNA